jgi:replicative DNA helicase
MTTLAPMKIYDPPEPGFEQASAAPAIPHNRDAEEAAVGCVLINPLAIYDMLFLKPEHFYIHRLRWIWKAMQLLEARRVPLDYLTVADELENQGLLAEVGGPAYLTALITVVPTSLNAEAYARVVKADAIRRDMIAAANKIAQLAYDSNVEIEQAVGEAVSATAALEVLSDGQSLIKLDQLLGETLDEITERAKDPKEVWGYATGLPTFDKKTGGLQLGELVYVVGGPGVGKTWLDLGWSMELGKQAPGAVISLEMKRGAIGRRLLSGLTGVSTRAMKSGFVADGDWDKLTGVIGEKSGFPVWVDDASYDTHRLRSTLAWAKREYGIRWFILDYALLLLDRGKDETEQSKLISANLKRIVHDLNLSGTILHSVVKIGMDGGDAEPRMSDQRGSGQAIHDADVQLFLTKLYDNDPLVSGLLEEQKKKMVTLWCSKGRELEESKFKIHLVRKGLSPFWGEYAAKQSTPQFRPLGREFENEQ